MAKNQDTITLRIIESFLDYGFWVQYQRALNEDPNSEVRAHVELYIGESKLGGVQQFTSSIGQKSGSVVKVQVMPSKSEYFFLVVNRDGDLYKYKLRKQHIMCPVPDDAIKIKPTIPRLKALATFWSKLPQDVADSRKALVAAATSLMATDPKWYREGLQFVRRNRRWEDHQLVPASSEAARVEPPPPRPSEDPLTAPYAQCFAKVPHHPDFGIPRPVTRSTYIPGTIFFYILCESHLICS